MQFRIYVDHQQKNQQNEWEIQKNENLKTKVESIIKRLDKAEGRILEKDIMLENTMFIQ